MSDIDPWWVNQTQAALCLGVTRRMVASMITAGQLHPIRVGGRWVLRRAEVDAVRAEWDAADAAAAQA